MGEAKDDPEETFRAYVAERGPALARAARLLTGDVHLAEDLVQTALTRAASRWERITAHGSPDPYVRRILHNEHISWWRKRRVTEVLGRVTDHDSSTTEVDVPTRVVLERALSRLTARQREVLVLRYYEDLSEAQTAHVMDVSVGTVKSQTRHALKRLRVLAPDLADLMEVTG